MLNLPVTFDLKAPKNGLRKEILKLLDFLVP